MHIKDNDKSELIKKRKELVKDKLLKELCEYDNKTEGQEIINDVMNCINFENDELFEKMMSVKNLFKHWIKFAEEELNNDKSIIQLDEREEKILDDLIETCIHGNERLLVAYFQKIAKDTIKDIDNPTNREIFISANCSIIVSSIIKIIDGKYEDLNDREKLMVREAGLNFIEFLKKPHFEYLERKNNESK